MDRSSSTGFSAILRSVAYLELFQTLYFYYSVVDICTVDFELVGHT